MNITTANCHGSVTASTKRVKVDCSAWRGHALAIAPHVFDNRSACLAARSFLSHTWWSDQMSVCLDERARPSTQPLDRTFTVNDQKLLLAVSFGTSFADTREKTIGAIERRIADRFPDCTIQRCFTSRMIRKKLLERDGLKIDSPEQAMQKAQEKGIRQLIVQPLYLMHGFEHRRLMETIREAASSFDKLKVGKPLLSDDADFCTMADAIRRNLPAPEPDTAVVLMGHGNEKKKKPIPEGAKSESSSARDIHDNAVFAVLQQTLRDTGADNYFVATVEGEPEISEILPVIKERGFRKVILAPFMVVAGDHARNDLAGEEDDSWKNIFTRSGFQVETILRGIGEWEEVQDLFADHAAQCMEETRI